LENTALYIEINLPTKVHSFRGIHINSDAHGEIYQSIVTRKNRTSKLTWSG